MEPLELTSRSSKTRIITLQELLARIDQDMRLMEQTYGLVTNETGAGLARDIKYLLADQIASRMWIGLYDPADRATILVEYTYTQDDSAWISEIISRWGYRRPTHMAFDVALEFTPEFQALDDETRSLLLDNTELNWRPYFE
ncbi:MAG: hypothetical protein HQK55_03015 [Deltaproteobacteria bacterium]|nr:hypothetical protein [Deltaproteobacteria bacterium]